MWQVWHRARGRWQRWRDDRAVARRPIPDRIWRRTLKRFAFLPQNGPQEQSLRRLASLFLDRKEFSAAGGLTLTDDMVVAIAAQACLPVLELGLDRYDGFVGVVVHPGQAKVRRSSVDADGVVHEYDEVLAGEAVDGGPVMLSWRDVRAGGARAADAFNVVVHEFAHVLDMAAGHADGVPLLPADIGRTEWIGRLQAEFEAFVDRVDGGDETTVLDPYGANAPEEFFAVASEAFFVNAVAFRAEHPQLYALFQRYYRQDPAARHAENGAAALADEAG